MGKISQPFLDRIDICMEAPKVHYEDLSGAERGWNSEQMRNRVMKARKRQEERFTGLPVRTNAQMRRAEIQKHCKLTKGGQEMMRQAYEIMNLTVRSYYKILKVARTIADLEEKEEIDLESLKEATGYRMIDKEYWGY